MNTAEQMNLFDGKFTPILVAYDNISVRDAGDFLLNGEYAQTGFINGRPSYQELANLNPGYLSWSEANFRWELGYINQVRYVGTIAAPTPNLDVWVSVGGAAPIPTVGIGNPNPDSAVVPCGTLTLSILLRTLEELGLPTALIGPADAILIGPMPSTMASAADSLFLYSFNGSGGALNNPGQGFAATSPGFTTKRDYRPPLLVDGLVAIQSLKLASLTAPMTVYYQLLQGGIYPQSYGMVSL